VGGLVEQLSEMVRGQLREPLSKYAVALHSLANEGDSEWFAVPYQEMRSAIKSLHYTSAQVQSDGAAWTLGSVAEQAHTLSASNEETGRRIGGDLWRLYERLLEDADEWFAHYQF